MKVDCLTLRTFTKAQVGTAITSITASDYIEGVEVVQVDLSARSGTNVTELTLSDVNGQFLNDENIINGNTDGRTITKITDFNIDDVKSMRSYVGVSTFEADLILDEISRLDNVTTGSFEYTKTSSTTGIITATGGNFAGILTTGNILSYSLGSSKVPQFNRVTGVSTTGDEVSIAAIPSIPNINNGSVSSSNKVTITDLRRRDTTCTHYRKYVDNTCQ